MSVREVPYEYPNHGWPTLEVPDQEKWNIANGILPPPKKVTPPPIVVPQIVQRVPVPSSAPVPLPVFVNASGAAVAVPNQMSLAGAVFAAVPKGALIGLSAFAVFFSIWNYYHFLLVGWHWAFVGLALVVGALLIGTGRTLVVLVAVACWFSREAAFQHPMWLVWFIGGGALVRMLWEFVP